MKYPVSVPGIGLVGGKFSDGDPEQGIAASLDSAGHMNAITDELINVISGFGLIPDEFVFNQVYKAIAGRVGTAGGLTDRNLIVNAAGTINQRGYVSGTATATANKPTLDRWRVVVLGQSLSWVANGATNLMTAPAGGVEQVFPAADIFGGTYVLNWAGTATATINGGAVAKGGTVVLPANTAATLRFINGTYGTPQLELGTVPTAFEFRDDLSRCQKDCELGQGAMNTYQVGVSGFGTSIGFKQTKRVAPVISFSNASYGNASGASSGLIGVDGFNWQAASSATGACSATFNWLAETGF